MNHSSFRIYLLIGLALLGIAWSPLAAQTIPSSYLAAEREIRVHDQLLTQLADSLENWLAGRQKHRELSSEITRLSKSLAPYRKLPAQTAQEVLRREREMVSQIQTFSEREDPDAEGQRALFLALSQYTEARSLKLLRWRQDTLHQLLSLDLSKEQHAYYRWEAVWVPMWLEEAELTRKLQQGFLESKTGSRQKQEVLQALLRLRLRADNTACPEAHRALDAKLKERLTVLARTAEQLLRLEAQKSSGTVTRVRRLSRQLSELTEQFQSTRLDTLQSLTPAG